MALNKNKITIHRTRIGKDIVAEFAIPISKKHQQEKRVAILAGGAPSMPSKNSFVEFLVTRGFYVINPRYRGTWESSGKFLEKEPTVDIEEVISATAKPFLSLWEKKKYPFPKKPSIYIFASSFGGPAGFLLSKDKRVKKVVAISAVTDWRDDCGVEPLDMFDSMTKRMYGEGYRLALNAGKKLKKGNFYNPMMSLNKVDGSKILMLHAEDDDVVHAHIAEDFADLTGAKLLISDSGGHMGLSELMTPHTWKQIQKFLK